jgi:hypothetical protein
MAAGVMLISGKGTAYCDTFSFQSESIMDSQQEESSRLVDRPTFFGLPPNFFLWARLGPTFWGGVLFGVGLGLFIAAWLAELGLQKSVWLGFLAIVMVGGGLGIAVRAARRSLQQEKDQPKNQ